MSGRADGVVVVCVQLWCLFRECYNILLILKRNIFVLINILFLSIRRAGGYSMRVMIDRLEHSIKN